MGWGPPQAISDMVFSFFRIFRNVKNVFKTTAQFLIAAIYSGSEELLFISMFIFVVFRYAGHQICQ